MSFFLNYVFLKFKVHYEKKRKSPNIFERKRKKNVVLQNKNKKTQDFYAELKNANAELCTKTAKFQLAGVPREGLFL